MKLFSTCLFFGLLAASAAAARADGTYQLLTQISVTGSGGWDYMSIDSAAHRLYVSHGTNVVVIDMEKDAVIATIPNTPGVHGLAPAPELGRGFISCGRDNTCVIVDLKTLDVISRVTTATGPDGMLYEPGRQEAYMFCGRASAATVIDAKTGSVVATIDLGGKPEFAAADPEAGRVYDNLEDKSEVAVIDTKTHQVSAHWPVAPGEEGSGMAIDTAHHRLFIGCGNKTMVMMDSGDGHVAGTAPIGEGVDATAFDPGTQLAFASCGDGTTTIAHEDSPDKLTVVQTLKTEPRAKTMALDLVTHRIYLGSAKFGAPSADEGQGGGRRRPRMIPGSFKILVYGQK